MIEEYIDKIVYPHLFTFLEFNVRVDLVFESSIKSATRGDSGKGIRRRVKLRKVPGKVPTHVIARNLGPARSLALPAFHAMTGCDMFLHILEREENCISYFANISRCNISNPDTGKSMSYNPKHRRKYFSNRNVCCKGVREESIDEGCCHLLLHKAKTLIIFHQVVTLTSNTFSEWLIKLDLYGEIL